MIVCTFLPFYRVIVSLQSRSVCRHSIKNHIHHEKFRLVVFRKKWHNTYIVFVFFFANCQNDTIYFAGFTFRYHPRDLKMREKTPFLEINVQTRLGRPTRRND